MGAFASRRSPGVEEVDLTISNAYRYPPQSGKLVVVVHVGCSRRVVASNLYTHNNHDI